MKKLSFLILLALIVALATVPAPLTHAATLDQVRLSWQNDPKTTITIMWRTEGNLTPHVQYGMTAMYGSEVIGVASPAVLDGFFYNTVELTGLTPNTLYHYRVSGDGTET